MNKGIDYGLGQWNVDKETGIRFGVINANTVDWWWDGAETNYGEPHCPKCGKEAQDVGEKAEDYEQAEFECSDHCCHSCRYVFGSESAYPESPLSWTYDKNGILATCGESGDIFVIRSPYFTRAQFCSPCAPGAVHLSHPMEEGERGYCLGHDWFEGGRAPYPVYSVKTGELVQPE